MISAFYDVAVIGAGPAGLAAALSTNEHGAKTLLIEREANLGGMLKQCLNDEFGIIRFGEKLTGPEYAYRFISRLHESSIEVSGLTFVSKIEKQQFGYSLTLVNGNGISKTACKSIVLACGCREHTPGELGINDRHPAGVITAGAVQYYINILEKMPTRRCVILGSGDIGLIMARRLRQKGAEVVGVYEANSTVSGLTRNVNECLDDYGIPLFTNKTVTRIYGKGRISAVEISSVDENKAPVPGTQEIIDCDALILSVGLIPENELTVSLKTPMDERTKGPVIDQDYMTMNDGIFCCGNALHVNDVVDYVTESGEAAGHAAARWASTGWISARRNGRNSYAEIRTDDSLSYIVPQRLNINKLVAPVTFYFRSKKEMGKSLLVATLNGNEIYRCIFPRLRPPEMEKLVMNLQYMDIDYGNIINFSLTEIPSC
ncbi:MAG: NAD(P)/FAD-dependent oxidoreductase [Treponema sp.]|nr:NAD(P)/FAD-dependent oxidoreductase [Treponema sp.]